MAERHYQRIMFIHQMYLGGIVLIPENLAINKRAYGKKKTIEIVLSRFLIVFFFIFGCQDFHLKKLACRRNFSGEQ